MQETSYSHFNNYPRKEDKEDELRRNLDMKRVELNMLKEKLARAERSAELKSKISMCLMVLGASLIAISCIEELSFFLAVGLAAFASSLLPYLSKTEPPSRIESEIRLVMSEIKSLEQRIKEVGQPDQVRPDMNSLEISFKQKE